MEQGETGKKLAIKTLFDEEIIQKHARYFFWKYQRFVSLSFENWEDFYVEIVLRIFHEKDSGRGPKDNCDGYYYKLTRNICEEMVRADKKSKEIQNHFKNLDEITSDPSIIEKIKHYIKKMECKCSTLMYHYHIEEELIRDKQKLVAMLKLNCKKDYTSGSIPVHLSGCLQKLSQTIQEDPDHLF